MTMREQMARAMLDAVENGNNMSDWLDNVADYPEMAFLKLADAALDLIANPSDEMVERCAEVLKAADSRRTWNGPDVHKVAARACLAAAVGDTTQ